MARVCLICSRMRGTTQSVCASGLSECPLTRNCVRIICNSIVQRYSISTIKYIYFSSLLEVLNWFRLFFYFKHVWRKLSLHLLSTLFLPLLVSYRQLKEVQEFNALRLIPLNFFVIRSDEIITFRKLKQNVVCDWYKIYVSNRSQGVFWKSRYVFEEMLRNLFRLCAEKSILFFRNAHQSR